MAKVNYSPDARTQTLHYLERCLKLASENLSHTHPINLEVALNLAQVYNEIGQVDKALSLGKEAFDNSISQLDTLDEESYKESTSIMQKIRDHLTVWSSLPPEEPEMPSGEEPKKEKLEKEKGETFGKKTKHKEEKIQELQKKSRAQYLKKREPQQLKEMESALKEEGLLFKLEKLTKEELKEMKTQKKLLNIAKKHAMMPPSMPQLDLEDGGEDFQPKEEKDKLIARDQSPPAEKKVLERAHIEESGEKFKTKAKAGKKKKAKEAPNQLIGGKVNKAEEKRDEKSRSLFSDDSAPTKLSLFDTPAHQFSVNPFEVAPSVEGEARFDGQFDFDTKPDLFDEIYFDGRSAVPEGTSLAFGGDFEGKSQHDPYSLPKTGGVVESNLTPASQTICLINAADSTFADGNNNFGGFTFGPSQVPVSELNVEKITQSTTGFAAQLPSLSTVITAANVPKEKTGIGARKKETITKRNKQFLCIQNYSAKPDQEKKLSPFGFYLNAAPAKLKDSQLSHVLMGPLYHPDGNCWLDSILLFSLSLPSIQSWALSAASTKSDSFVDLLTNLYHIWICGDHESIFFRKELSHAHKNVWKKFDSLGFSKGKPHCVIQGLTTILKEMELFIQKVRNLS